MVSRYTIDQIPVEMQMMDDSARIWIFQSNRKLEDKDILLASEEIRHFLEQWTAHNRQLDAYGGVFYNRFIVIALDELNSSQASGCSIDSLTRYIQNVGDQLDVNVMDRENFYFYIKDEIVSITMSAMSKAYEEGIISEDSLVFNNLVKNKGEFFKKWLVPLKESWHWRFIK